MKRVVIYTFFLTLILVVLVKPGPGTYRVAQANTRKYVAPVAQGTGDCSSWANACTLNTAVSTGWTELWIKAGRYLYLPSNNAQCLASAYGGFAGWETSLSQRDLRNNLTIMTGDIGNDDITDANGIVLDYADIRGTNHTMACSIAGDTTIDGIIFTGYIGGATGQAIFYTWRYNYVFRNVVFSGINGTSITHSANSDNRSLTIENAVFRGMKIGLSIGSLHGNQWITVRNALFYGNHNDSFRAAGLHAAHRITLENSIFMNNVATFVDYYGSAGGARIGYSERGVRPYVQNNVFINNTGTQVGGLHLTYSGYTAPPWDDGAYLINNIFANNISTRQAGINQYANDVLAGTITDYQFPNYHNNLIKNSADCSPYPNIYSPARGNICGVDPQLGTLQYNGGFIDTISPLPGSPAIDAGLNNGLSPDARGVARPQDGNNDGIAAYDIGAVEYVPDTTPPTVSSITRLDASPTSASTVRFQVTFSESVKNVDVNDFVLTVTGTLSGTSIASVSGSGATYTVTVNTGSGNGTIRLDIPSGATIQDMANNNLTGLPYTNGEVYDVDRTAPTVSSITRLGSSPTNANQVQYAVAFSESVTGVSAADFSLTVSGISGASVASVSGSGSSYTVTVNTGTGNGTIRLDIPASATINDLAGNGLSGLPYTDGEVYEVDKTAPSVISITRGAPSPTNASSVTYNVVFSENVTGVSASDFVLTLTGTLSGASVASVSGSGTSYTVTVNTGSGTGTLRLDIPASATISDMAGNNLAGIPYTSGELYFIDRIAPLVVSVTRLGTSPTNASQVLFRVVFSEEVIGVTIGDFALHTTGTITGAYVVSVSGSGTTYTVTVNTGTGSGTIRLDVVN